MRFLVFSDTHGKHRLLKNLPEADVVIHAGDVSKEDGSERSVVDFLRWFSSLEYGYKIFIAGNHDPFFEQESEKYIAKTIPSNVIYLNDSRVSIEGVEIWGSPVTPTFWNWAFNRERGKSVNKHWKLIPEDTDILITHGPPAGILDQVGANDHAGCADLLKRVKSIKPRYHLFGHIHGGYGTLENGETTFINASVVDDQYILKNPPVLFSF